MTDAEFDKHIDSKLCMEVNPLECGCMFGTPHRPPPATPEEALRRLEFKAKMSWGCTCQLSVCDAYKLINARKTIQRCKADPGFNTPTDEELGIRPDGRIDLKFTT